MSPADRPPELTDTAAMIARIRADEGALEEKERLFHDPFAELFLGDATARELTERVLAVPFLREQVRLRTRFIDDRVRKALVEGLRQIVVAGAGFDCRSLRLEELRGKDALVFEVDFPAQLEAKQRILSSAGIALPEHLRFVPADLTAPGWEPCLSADLARAGFRAGAGALFVCEGLVTYLSGEDFDRLCRFAAESAGRRTSIVFNYSIATLDPASVPGRLRISGFAEVEDRPLSDLHRSYLGREPPAGGEFFRIAVAEVG